MSWPFIRLHLPILQSFIVAAVLIAAASAIPAGPPPAYGPAPTYPDIPPVYNYQYAVADDYSGANFAQNENRDGYATSGSYTVALPDGRLQTVTYRVDNAESGYIADVVYSGEPTYGPSPKVAAKPIHG